MFSFYLRQTVPFTLRDIPTIIRIFFNKKISHDLIEKEIARKVGVSNAVLTGSMREGLQLSLKYYLRNNPNRNVVLIPEYSFHSNLSAVLNLGIQVKFVPIDAQTLEIYPNSLERYIDRHTLGLILTHMHGLMYPIQKILPVIHKHKIILFEDCAHIFGVNSINNSVGSESVGCFSFGAGKNITSFGGGAITTNDLSLYNYLKSKQISTFRYIENIKILIKTILYIIISTPVFSYLIMKPLLGIQLIIHNKKREEDKFIIDKRPLLHLKIPCGFQLKLLDYQLVHLKSRIDKIIDQRKCIALLYDVILHKSLKMSKDNVFFFQYPLKVKDSHVFITRAWKYNIDVQRDYCSNLPSLMNNISKPHRENITRIYLPTNQYLSRQYINKIIPKLMSGE